MDSLKVGDRVRFHDEGPSRISYKRRLDIKKGDILTISHVARARWGDGYAYGFLEKKRF